MGGIGKTALADAVTREVITSLRFERVIWLRFDPRTLTGRSLSPEHAFHGLLAQLAARLGFDTTSMPDEQLARSTAASTARLTSSSSITWKAWPSPTSCSTTWSSWRRPASSC
jgi:hypothetical protein